jgi:hypothetical protein
MFASTILSGDLKSLFPREYRLHIPEVCGDGILIQLSSFWTLSVALFFI